MIMNKKGLDMDKFIKNDKRIIEGVVVSFVAGFALTSILRKSYLYIGDVQFPSGNNFIISFLMIIILSLILGIINYKYENISKIMMFAFVYIYGLLCSYVGSFNDWKDKASNSIGNTCYQGIWFLIVAICFWYVKEDVYRLFSYFKLSQKKMKVIVWAIGIVLFIIVGLITVFRYLTYSNTTFDFGIFAQMYEYMIQTGTVDTTLERSRLLSHFAVHFSPIYYISIPIYFLFPSPITVQLIQATMVALPIIPIVLISRKYKLHNWLIVGIVLLYALYPATAGGTLYDMHENCFLTFFVLMTVWACEKKKNILLIFMMLVTLLVKEDAAVYLLVLGFYYFMSRKDKKRGAILMIASLIYFAIAVSIVNSYGLGIMDNRFANLFYDQNGGLIQVFCSILSNPGYVIGQMVRNSDANAMDKIEYYILMFAPMSAAIFTMGRKYSRYILLSPLVIINLFTTYTYMHDIRFQYNFGIIALLIYLVIMNLAEIDTMKAKKYISLSVICASIMFAGTILPKLTHYTQKYVDNKSVYKVLDVALEKIPSDASVCASGYFTPHLSKNLVLYDQNHLNQDIYTEYLVVDERYEYEKEQFETILNSGKYESVYKVDDLISIYKIKDKKDIDDLIK